MVDLPLWKIWVGWGYYSQYIYIYNYIYIYMESHKIHVPNHQPGDIYIYICMEISWYIVGVPNLISMFICFLSLKSQYVGHRFPEVSFFGTAALLSTTGALTGTLMAALLRSWDLFSWVWAIWHPQIHCLISILQYFTSIQMVTWGVHAPSSDNSNRGGNVLILS